MGYQQSYITFNKEATLQRQLVKYMQRDHTDEMAYVVGVVKCLKDCIWIKKDQFAMIISGERYPQRDKETLQDETGIRYIKEIIFIDNPVFYELSKGNISSFLDEHFHCLTNEELKENFSDIFK